jgi:hypothetical protein
MTRRAPLPTLTEDDLREQGERQTLPPPVPIGVLVDGMMGDLDGDVHGFHASPGSSGSPGVAPAPQAPALPSATSISGALALELELDDLEGSAESSLLAEISDTYLGRLGSRAHVPFARMPPADLRRRSLDHWAGFVLSLVDGEASVEDILDAAAMPEHEALRLLCELREQGLIDVRPQSFDEKWG